MARKPQQTKASTGAHWIGNPSGPRLLSLKDASAYTGLSQWTLREIVWRGALPVVKAHPTARKWWFKREDLDSWIDKNTFIVT